MRSASHATTDETAPVLTNETCSARRKRPRLSCPRREWRQLPEHRERARSADAAAAIRWRQHAMSPISGRFVTWYGAWAAFGVPCLNGVRAMHARLGSRDAPHPRHLPVSHVGVRAHVRRSAIAPRRPEARAPTRRSVPRLDGRLEEPHCVTVPSTEFRVISARHPAPRARQPGAAPSVACAATARSMRLARYERRTAVASRPAALERPPWPRRIELVARFTLMAQWA